MKIGILGMGSIGQRHWRNANDLGHASFGYDPSLLHAPSVREQVIREATAVVIASPSKQHAHDLTDALGQGKHVLVEKPFGYDCPPYLKGYVQGSRANHGAGLIIATGFNLRFHHCVRFVKSFLRIPSLGNLLCASFTVNQKTLKPPYLMDGIIRNWMSHEIDLAHYFFGEGEVISCAAPADSEGRDISECFIGMKFPSVEQTVYLQGDYYSDPEQRFFWIEGEKGAIYCNLVTRQVFLRMKGEDPKLVYQAKDTWDENYQDEMKCFIESIQRGEHQAPLATGEDGVRALYTVMAARQMAGLKDGTQG